MKGPTGDADDERDGDRPLTEDRALSRNRESEPTDTRADGDGDDEEADGGMERRTLVRILVGLGIGIPLLVELRTLSQFVASSFGDERNAGGREANGEGEPDPTESNGSESDRRTRTPSTEPTSTAGEPPDDTAVGANATGGGTATPRPVGVGDELLPATAPAETIRAATVRTDERGRRFVLRVAVTNDTDAAYDLRLGRLVTAAGGVVEGGGAKRIDPGGRATVTGEWLLPDGARPTSVFVVAVVEGNETRTVSERVPIEPASNRS